MGRKKIKRINLGWDSKKVKMDKHYNPKIIGQNTEAQILARFLKYGKTVLFPFGDNERYDLVVDEEGDFIRVQCKTGEYLTDIGDSFIFSSRSTNWNNGKSKNYYGQADIFAIYLRENDEVYIFKVNNCSSRQVTVRLVNYKENNVKFSNNHILQFDKKLREYE